MNNVVKVTGLDMLVSAGRTNNSQDIGIDLGFGALLSHAMGEQGQGNQQGDGEAVAYLASGEIAAGALPAAIYPDQIEMEDESPAKPAVQMPAMDIPAPQMTNGPIVQANVSQLQFAKQLSELANVQQVTEEMLSDIQKIEILQKQPSAREFANQQGISGRMFEGEELSQNRFDSFMEKITRELGDKYGKTAFEAELPIDALENREMPELIRVTERGILNADRSPEQVAPLPAKTDQQIEQRQAEQTEQPILAHQQPTSQPQIQGSAQPQQVQEFEGRMAQLRDLNQISDQVIRNVKLENTEFRMTLNPQELGIIDIRMSWENSRMVMNIIAFSEQTAALLTRNTEGLINSLRVMGIDTQNITVVAATPESSEYLERGYDRQPDSQQEDQEGRSSRDSEEEQGEQQSGEENLNDQPKPPSEHMMDIAV